MPLTPIALSAKISQLVKEGYPQKQAIAIAYSEMRIAWRDKHPVGKFPVWLLIESRGKNPKKMHKYETFMRDGSHIFYNAARGSWLYQDKHGKIIDSVSDEIFSPETNITKIKKYFTVPSRRGQRTLTRDINVRKNPIDGPGIVTKYISPSNAKGARIKAYRSGFPKLNKTYAFPDELSGSDAHEAVAKAFMHHLGWNGTLSGAETDTGYFFVVHKVKQGAVRKNPVRASGVKIVFNKLLGGWYVVRGPHHTPIGGGFNSKEEAQDWLNNRHANRHAKNPVRPLKRKREFTLQTFIEGRTYYWTGVKFDTLIQKAITFNSIPLAKLAAKAAYKEYPKINIYLEGPGITA